MYCTNLVTVKKFLEKVWDFKTPLLLALSGGPDSLALFYLLREIHPPVPFAVAHVDHGWREESGKEAESLAFLAKKYQIPFHLKKLEIPKESPNLEELCREARLEFFRSLIKQEGYAAVLLGHHGDDQAELILKRIFEGAPLTTLRGMNPVAQNGEMFLWRPLLTLKKRDLENWLLLRGEEGFNDSSNIDPRFLKGRMRTTLLPFLSKEFGKEISPRLIKWGKEADELQSFIREATAPLEKWVVRGQKEINLNADGKQIHPFLLKQFILQLVGELDLKIAEKGVDTAVTLLQTGAANKEISLSGGRLKIDRGRITIEKTIALA